MNQIRISLQLRSSVDIVGRYKSVEENLLKRISQIGGVFFDLDGVLAAEVLGCDIVIKLIFAFFEHIQSILWENYSDDGHDWIFEVMKNYANVELPLELDVRYLSFLCNTWKSLQMTGRVMHPPDSVLEGVNEPVTSVIAIDNLSYQRLHRIYQNYSTHKQRHCVLYSKWIFQASNIGHEFCANLPLLPRGIEFLQSVQSLNFPIVGILTSTPDPTYKLNQLCELLGEPFLQMKAMRSAMHANNTTGKNRWIQTYVNVLPQHVIICSHGKDKKYCLDNFIKDNSKSYVLIDDLVKNTKPFGQNGYLVPSEGTYRLF